MEIILFIALTAIIGILYYKYYKLKLSNGSYAEVEEKLARTNAEYTALQVMCQHANDDLDTIRKTQVDYQHEVIALTAKRNELKDIIEEHQTLITNQNSILASYEQQYETIKKAQEERCLRAAASASQKIQAIEDNCKLTIAQKESETKVIIEELATQLENERQKYLSIIETVQNAQSEEEKDINRHIQIRETVQDDINYLLNNVANKLSNPDILYKLIWSEYIQKPTNEMLDFILPQRDCPGIYKITNDKNKKAYIGRSTSVRKRLTDHIKSAVGISTIADQRVHQAMREEGLWNFTFELIEECDKDKLNEREKFYIQFFSTEQLGYNQKAGG